MINFHGVNLTEQHLDTILKLVLQECCKEYAKEYERLMLLQYAAITQHDMEIYEQERKAQEKCDYYNNVIDMIMRLARNVQ